VVPSAVISLNVVLRTWLGVSFTLAFIRKSPVCVVPFVGVIIVTFGGVESTVSVVEFCPVMLFAVRFTVMLYLASMVGARKA